MNGNRSAAAAIPSGTVTFLFTDIEGSTRRWDADRAAMSEAVARHDALARIAIVAHRGHIFKTLGDGFCCAFNAPDDALAAARELQRSLASEDFAAVGGLRIRVALHTGSADERDADYFGPTVNRIARLLSTAHGDQVVVSGTAHDALSSTVDSWATFKNLGVHRLKDLTHPEQVYQLVANDLRADFPQLRSLTALPNNLPAYLSSFVGRERDVAEITAMLGRARLVTLVGSGGIGKTRTSLQVAANLLDGSGDGVWFIELASLANGEYLPSTVAHVLGVNLAPEGDAIANLSRELRAKRALLIFDNCEHLIDSAARVIAALLRSCPSLKILASSRQALGVSGEETYRLPSLDVPAADVRVPERIDAQDALRWSAIALFGERARAADNRFSLTRDNAGAVVDICRRLDGIPLAIELAAARVSTLSPRQLGERLDERFRVLTGGSRDVLPRQQTLRALIDWSYDLLDERERAFFRRLGTFFSGFSLEGALAIEGNDAQDYDTVDLLASLVNKSLVLCEPMGDASRYRMLESTRAYAREKLLAAGERDICASRHRGYLRDIFAEAHKRWEATARSAESRDLLVTELDEVRGALDGSSNDSEAVVGAELLAHIWKTWTVLGLSKEGLERVENALAAIPEAPERVRARLSLVYGYLCANAGRHATALAATTRAVTYARACEDAATLAQALTGYAVIAALLGSFSDAAAALKEAEEIPSLPTAVRLDLLLGQAWVSSSAGDHAVAARAYERLRREYRLLGNDHAERLTALNLAEVLHEDGRTLEAIALAREVLPGLRMQSDRMALVTLLGNFAGYLATVDDIVGARAAAREAIAELASGEPDSALLTVALEHFALALALGGNLESGATLTGYADAALRRRGYERHFTENTTRERLTALLRERFPPHALARLFARGSDLMPEAAIAIALAGPEGDR